MQHEPRKSEKCYVLGIYNCLMSTTFNTNQKENVQQHSEDKHRYHEELAKFEL